MEIILIYYFHKTYIPLYIYLDRLSKIFDIPLRYKLF